LFQDKENMGQIENSRIGDYSCIKLLRDMEALEQEEEEEVQDHEELVTLPEDWCARFVNSMQTNGLPKDLLSIPEVIKVEHNDVREEAREDGLGGAQKINRGKWGPTLVGKRPS
jgi:hypothetical protein